MTNIYETERDVLRDMLHALEPHYEQTPTTVLRLQARALAARLGLPRPNFQHWPSHEMADVYFSRIAEIEENGDD